MPPTTSTARSRWSPAPPAASASRRPARCTRGASVVVVDLDADRGREAAERIGERAIGIAADVTDRGAMMAAVAEAVERFGGLDVVVANAGIAPDVSRRPAAMSTEEWERVIEVNLLGVWRTVRAALPQIVRAPRPRRRHRLGLLLRQRHVGEPLRGRQGRRRGDGPRPAARAGAVRGERQRRLLRLGRHEDGPGRARPREGGDRLQRTLPDFLLKRITPRGRRRPSSAASRARAAHVRAELVALHLRPARAPQPALRPAHRARREAAASGPPRRKQQAPAAP